MNLIEENIPKLLDQKAVAEIIGKSESWLERCRWSGTGGPPYKKIGRHVRYDLQDVLTWIDRQPRITNTRNFKGEVDNEDGN